MKQSWQTTRFELDVSTPLVMGIVNVTPDSFSTAKPSQSALELTRQSLELAQAQLEARADLLDLGAESTRPGAPVLSEAEEWARLEPVLREVLTWGVPVSVDTYKSVTMKRALDLGADVINDVFALRQAGALELMAQYRCGICLMHLHLTPQTMQISPMEDPVVEQVIEFLLERVLSCERHGVSLPRLMLDPGIGFGKTTEQNFSLLARQAELHVRGLPLLVGWSRKSSLGAVTGLEVHQRLIPSVAAAVLAMERGAQVIRVHDVSHTVAARSVWLAQRPQRPPLRPNGLH
jgi:dihydropteroate synthase